MRSQKLSFLTATTSRRWPIALTSIGLFASCGSEDRPALSDTRDGGAPVGNSDGIESPTDIAGGPTGAAEDYPASCAEAAAARSYIGCEYWPTVTFNRVRSAFDFVAVVANGSTREAKVHVTGPAAFVTDVVVPAGEVRKVYLPWVLALKGEDITPCTAAENKGSVLAKASAYRLVSDVPVVVYQFNALQYKAEPRPGKDLSTCETLACEGAEGECYSYSNDASILLPTAALDTDYRVLSSGPPPGLMRIEEFPSAFLAVTATADDTKVTVALGKTGNVRATFGDDSVLPVARGGKADYVLAAGDVLQLAGSTRRVEATDYDQTDFSGTIVSATKPVQVISGAETLAYPTPTTLAGDHVEESVLPGVALGSRYVVARPTGPGGGAVSHVVRLVGNVDGTVLTYQPAKPVGCPDTLDAGEVVHCGLSLGASSSSGSATALPGVVDIDFEVSANHAFAAGTFLLGASIVDPSNATFAKKGDPSFATSSAVEQWRSRYLVLAPNDYEETFLDIVIERGVSVSVDGTVTSAPRSAIGGTAFETVRVPVSRGGAETHALAAAKPFSVTVVGYGAYTSYSLPGGLNVRRIAPPPVIK